MNTTYHYEQVEMLWAKIARLQGQIVEFERRARDMSGDEDSCRLAQSALDEARSELEKTRIAHGIEAHFLLRAMRPANQRAA